MKSSFWDKNKTVERYSIDPEQISLRHFLKLTRSKKLIPSRILLQDGIDQYFLILEERGIQNLKQLSRALGNSEKIKGFSVETQIPENYLILLKREAGSYRSRPMFLSDFPGIPLEYTEVLKAKGIRNSRECFESLQSPGQRQKWAKLTGIPLSRLAELLALCDLSRITGVGGIYARIIYHAGIRSVKQFALTSTLTHHELYLKSLEKLGYPLKALGEEDLLYCISYAQLIVEINSNPNQA